MFGRNDADDTNFGRDQECGFIRLHGRVCRRPLVAIARHHDDRRIAHAGRWPAAAEPITLSIIDTGGDLASIQVIIENYKKAYPDKVKEIKIQRAPAPELPAKIKAQQDAGRLDINLVLTGQDGGSVLAANNQLIKIFRIYEKLFPRDDTDRRRARRCRTRATAYCCRRSAMPAVRC